MRNLMENELTNSLQIEDFLRRIFLTPLVESNLAELLELTNGFKDEFREHKFVTELEKCELNLTLLDEVRYEFNSLFVGPRRPKAVPYESTYFDYKTMFGSQTMHVRQMYEASGLKVVDDKFDKFPDDFIGYELQYLYFLTHQASVKFNNANTDEFYEIIRQKSDFIVAHPSKWFDKFSECCNQAAKLEVWKNFGDFLMKYLNNESENLTKILALNQTTQNLKG